MISPAAVTLLVGIFTFSCCVMLQIEGLQQYAYKGICKNQLQRTAFKRIDKAIPSGVQSEEFRVMS